ncbi:hypothetical protein CK203_043281 [Vitis vinifera]|uniref:Ubiquitin-like protease family profile domain-containing protein n=1 Tax=Vitis vinifera TaxID=29760 RepID=A0A438HP82_VITVI|nr:hypothetical protein CK203_043281 [Vitis vinifera]
MGKRTHIQVIDDFFLAIILLGNKKAFNGEQEFRSPLQPLSGEEILRKIDVICNSWGKNKMTQGKTKDGLNSRLDLLEMGLRCELGPSGDIMLLEKYFPPFFFDIMPPSYCASCKRGQTLWTGLPKIEVAIGNNEPISETLKWIAHGPSHYVSKYHGYVINGCRYHRTLPEVEAFDAMDDSDAICIREIKDAEWVADPTKQMDPEKGEKPQKGVQRNDTKVMITKNRSKGIKLQECQWSNDILVEALGTPEYSGRVRAKGKHHIPRQYFNSAVDRAVRDFIAASKEEQRNFQAEVLAKLSQVGVVTPQSDVSSSNMKQKQLLLLEVVEKPIRRGEDASPLVPIEPKNKVRKCELAVETKENIVAGGTIILECGPNYLVVVDASYDSSAPFPFLFLDKLLLLGLQLVTQVLWPAHLVIIHTLISTSKKGKKQKENEVEVKSKGEKAQDIKNFEALVGLMLSTSRVHPVDFPDDVFGESFKTFLMKEDMDMIISSKEVSSNCILYYIWHLHRKLIDGKQVEQYVFVNPALVSKAGMGEGSKENSFHWVLVSLEMKRMIAYYLDPMACQPCDDLREIVNIVQDNQVVWNVGIYVMRYMKEIIANPNQLTSKFNGRKTYSEMEINEVRSDWVMLMTQLIITHVEVGSVFNMDHPMVALF